MRRVGTPSLQRAAGDYRWLLDRGYPSPSSLKLVGDRFQLDTFQRRVLARGIVPSGVARARRRRLVRRIRGRVVHVDCCNVLLTISSYLLGLPVFLANDGLLRDAAEDHGKISGRDAFDRALELLARYLARRRPARAQLYVDAPFPFSGELASRASRLLEQGGTPGSAQAVRSPDFALKSAAEGIIATSDSAVVDGSVRPVVDLARNVLESEYRPRFLRLARGPVWRRSR